MFKNSNRKQCSFLEIQERKITENEKLKDRHASGK